MMDSESVFCSDQGDEIDIIGTNYYKLPFCDEDVKQLKELDWMSDYMNDDLTTPSSPSSHSSCHSPSSSSSSSHSNQAPLINDRPDTPLIAVKLEDFSNGDYQLGDLDQGLSSAIPNWSTWPDTDNHAAFGGSNEGLENAKFVFDGDTAELTFDNEPPKIVHLQDKVTLDRTLTSSIYDSFESNKPTQDQFTVFVKDDDSQDMDISSIHIPDISENDQQQPTPMTTKSNTVKSVFLPNTSSANVFTLPASLNNNNIEFVPNPKRNGEATKRHATATVVSGSGHQKTQIQIPTSTLHTILKSGRLITKLQQEGQMLPRIKIKTEPGSNDQSVTICQPMIDVQLPLTPNSANTSDSEGSGNRYSEPSSPGLGFGKCRLMESATATQLAAQMLTSPQRLSQTHGPLVLTEEEKRTLVAEGYSVPARLPLTKGEEKALKKIRRKIKNKISAQESRRKKKEYVEALEKKMEVFNQENTDLRRKLDSLENSNKSLLSQLRSLQMLVAGKMPKPSRTVTTQTSSCLMVFVLCFAVFLGGWYPRLSPKGTDIMTSQTRHPLMTSQLWHSRVLSLSPDDKSICMDKKNIEENNEANKVADETYETPKTGRIVMNDTGDSKIIRNTMEPMDAAAIIASRKAAVESGNMDVGMDGIPPVDMDTKKLVIASRYIKE